MVQAERIWWPRRPHKKGTDGASWMPSLSEGTSTATVLRSLCRGHGVEGSPTALGCKDLIRSEAHEKCWLRM
jgi:hypothetical protein